MTEILLTTNFSFKACTEPNSFELCRAVEKSTKLIERIIRMGASWRPQTPGDLRTPVKEYSNLWGVASEGGTIFP